MGYYSIVEAVYKEPACPVDANNYYIKAIPFPITDEIEMLRYYTKTIPDFNSKCTNESNPVIKRIMLSQIRELRFYLPFEQDLEIKFHESLLNSYRNRVQILDEKSQTYKLIGNAGNGTNPGFSLLGYSGCGKSSAIKMLLDHYPQTIVHNFDGNQTCQVLYLVVSCIPNSNFRALYAGIGRALDRALHVEIYETLIEKTKTLGGKQQVITGLIEKFAIGAIILDEIQLIDFSGTKENTFESFMVIANQTKVSIIVIGTEDSYKKMFCNLRTARRLGPPIPAYLYCENKEYVTFVVKKLFGMQLFDTRVDPTEDITNAFYEETKGIIDMIIMLYISVQDAYIAAEKKPVVNGDYVRKVMKNRFSELGNYLKEIGEVKNQLAIQKLLRNSSAAYETEITALKQQKTMQSAMSNYDKEGINNVIREVVSSISLITNSFTSVEIEKVAKKVICNKKLEEINVTEVTLNTYKIMSDKKAPKVKKSKSTISKEEMASVVFSDEK